MKYSGESLENLLGVNQRARYKKEVEILDQYFETPIIHREIHGDKIYVPLNLDYRYHMMISKAEEELQMVEV